MRLLIYLLAMMTGFSAGNAARPVSATPATLGSAVSQVAVIVASLPAESSVISARRHDEVPSLPGVLAGERNKFVPNSLVLTSPVSRHDIALQ